jgi:AcrR family transcriptional regulator
MRAKDTVYLQNFNSPQTKGDRTKSAIAEAAAVLLSTQGYGVLSFEQVARSMSLKRAHICYHFKDLGELEAALFRWIGINAQACVVDHLEKAAASRARKAPLLTYLEAHLHWVLEYRDHHRAYASLIPQCAHSPLLKADFDATAVTAQARIEGLLKLGRPKAATGELQDLSFLFYHGLIALLIRTSLLEKDAAKKAEFQRFIRSVARVAPI